MFTGRQGCQTVLQMIAWRCGDIHRVNIGVSQQDFYRIVPFTNLMATGKIGSFLPIAAHHRRQLCSLNLLKGRAALYFAHISCP